MPGPPESPDADGYLSETGRIERIDTQHFLRSYYLYHSIPPGALGPSELRKPPISIRQRGCPTRLQTNAQSFSDNRQESHIAEIAAVSTPPAPDIDQTDTTPTPPPGPRRLWFSDQDAGDNLLKWQNVILIQHGQDIGFTQAPIQAGLESTRTSGSEKYQGHVLQILIEVRPTESIGNIVHKALMECYFLRSIVPSPETYHYTLGEYPSNLVWAQDRIPEHSLHLNASTGREISLSHEDKLEWITQEDSTILVFLPPPDTGRATSPQCQADMLTRGSATGTCR